MMGVSMQLIRCTCALLLLVVVLPVAPGAEGDLPDEARERLADLQKRSERLRARFQENVRRERELARRELDDLLNEAERRGNMDAAIALRHAIDELRREAERPPRHGDEREAEAGQDQDQDQGLDLLGGLGDDERVEDDLDDDPLDQPPREEEVADGDGEAHEEDRRHRHRPDRDDEHFVDPVPRDLIQVDSREWGSLPGQVVNVRADRADGVGIGRLPADRSVRFIPHPSDRWQADHGQVTTDWLGQHGGLLRLMVQVGDAEPEPVDPRRSYSGPGRVRLMAKAPDHRFNIGQIRVRVQRVD